MLERVASSSAVCAQQPASLGDLLDLGAQKLSSAEVQSLGELRIVRRAADADADMTLRADGTVVGMVHNKQGFGSSEAVGSWHLQADGKRCADVQLPAFRMDMRQCGYTWRLGKSLFFASSDHDRAVAVSHHAGNAFLD